MRVIRWEGNDDEVKYWAPRCGDAVVVKAAAGALAKLASAKNTKYKKVLDAKQWNNRRRNALAILDDEIVRRGAGVGQNMVNSCKETTEAVPETRGREGLQNPVLTAGDAETVTM